MGYNVDTLQRNGARVAGNYRAPDTGGSAPMQTQFTPHDVARFWSQVSKTSSCWNWTAYRDRFGYGRFNSKRHPFFAHRVAWELQHGHCSDKPILHHICENPGCVNPDHLLPVTQREHRSIHMNGTLQNNNQCDNGHLFDESNTYIAPSGKRRCRACFRVNSANYKVRKRREGE